MEKLTFKQYLIRESVNDVVANYHAFNFDARLAVLVAVAAIAGVSKKVAEYLARPGTEAHKRRVIGLINKEVDHMKEFLSPEERARVDHLIVQAERSLTLKRNQDAADAILKIREIIYNLGRDNEIS